MFIIWYVYLNKACYVHWMTYITVNNIWNKLSNLIKHSTITAKIQYKFNVAEDDDENPKI